jgi:hypothetical protein
VHERAAVAPVYVMDFLEVASDGLRLNCVPAGGADDDFVEGEILE